jgi:hypothetical protein
MSIYSTASIKRADAELLLKLLDTSRLSDKLLEQVLFMLVGDMTFHNFNIHHEGDEVGPGGLIDRAEVVHWLERLYKEAE